MLQSGTGLATPGLTIENGMILTCNGAGLKNLLEAGTQWLELHKEVVNGLNVFPVPDGDTGTNMLLTMRAALAEVENATDHRVATIAAAAARGALVGARGNSGVILSQFLQGVAGGLKNKTTFTAKEFAQAVEEGAAQAYQSVIEPVEGTILTVARAASEAARRSVKTNQDLGLLLADIVAAVRVAQASTPELLPVLKEAGVTDSGGQGLLYILEGGLRLLTGQPVDLDPAGAPVPVLQSTLGVDKKTYGYDVQFLIRGEQLDVDDIRANINAMGRSTVVVGDAQLVKVHLHTGQPDLPVNYGATVGSVSNVVVENLEEQARAFVRAHAASTVQVDPPAAGTTAGIATVAVVAGQGLADIFKSLGVSRVVFGGQTMNPSTQELLNVVEQVEAGSVLILPNNSNIILAAQQVQKLSPKNVQVVPTRTIPQGIAALLAFNIQADAETNARRMLSAAGLVQTFEITRAVRDTRLNRLKINCGDVVALCDNELVGAGQHYDDVTLAGLAGAVNDAHEVVTIYYGQESSQERAEILAGKINRRFPDLDVELYDGGQPHYYYIISLE